MCKTQVLLTVVEEVPKCFYFSTSHVEILTAVKTVSGIYAKWLRSQ